MNLDDVDLGFLFVLVLMMLSVFVTMYAIGSVETEVKDEPYQNKPVGSGINGGVLMYDFRDNLMEVFYPDKENQEDNNVQPLEEKNQLKFIIGEND